jgi:hypothetical protein
MNPSAENASDNRHGTLVIAAVGVGGIAVAADSAGIWLTGENELSRKFYPIGRYGAVLIHGQSAITLRRNNVVVDTVDLVETISSWIAANPETTLITARQFISDEIAAAFTNFFARNPSARMGLGAHLVFVGYEGSSVAIYTAGFVGLAACNSIPPPRFGNFRALQPGYIVPLGAAAVANEILSGSSAAFQSYKHRFVVRKFRSRPTEMTAVEMARLSLICLLATESEEGRNFNTDSAGVIGPNDFAIIYPERGFQVFVPE